MTPLATVEPMVTVAGGYGGVRIGGPKGPMWGVNGGLFDRQHDPPAAAVAESLAHDINAAHFKVVSRLRGQLAVARAELVSIHGGRTVHDIEPKSDCSLCRAILAIDDPGEFVEKAKLDDLQRVLADALDENGERKYRERCEKAVAYLNSIPTRAPSELGGVSWELAAILEGREPKPAMLPDERDE